jgi:peptide-methionine (S)-S-oxide reductase
MRRTLSLRSALVLLLLAFLLPLCAKTSPSRANAAFPKPVVDDPISSSHGQQQAVLSGGCFWGVQAVFEHTRGVLSAVSGYAGGDADTAHYEMVGAGTTGHAESVKVIFDPSQITYGEILMIFFSVAHDPTQLNKQGPDWGTQYRSALFYSSPEQKKIAEAYIVQLDAAKVYPQKIVTQVVPLKEFFPAESYHQDFVKHHPDNPYIVINDLPKLTSLRKQFPELYREP